MCNSYCWSGSRCSIGQPCRSHRPSWVLPPLSVGKMTLRLYSALNYSHGLSKGPSFGTGREWAPAMGPPTISGITRQLPSFARSPLRRPTRVAAKRVMIARVNRLHQASGIPHIPDPPSDFPDAVNFAIGREEVEYLQDRIRAQARGSLLAHLIDEGGRGAACGISMVTSRLCRASAATTRVAWSRSQLRGGAPRSCTSLQFDARREISLAGARGTVSGDARRVGRVGFGA